MKLCRQDIYLAWLVWLGYCETDVDSRASTDHATLYELLQCWPADWFDSANIITAVTEKLKTIGAFGDFASSSSADGGAASTVSGGSFNAINAEEPNTHKKNQQQQVGLADCLALLLTQRGEHQRSLELRLALALSAKRRKAKNSDATTVGHKHTESRAKHVFDYVDAHALHMYLCPLVRPLIVLHSDRAMSFFVQNSTKIPVSDVASQLQTGREDDTTQLHTFLQKAFVRNPHDVDGKQYHTSHVEWLARRVKYTGSTSKLPSQLLRGQGQEAEDDQETEEEQEGQPPKPKTNDLDGSKSKPTDCEEALLKFLKASPYYDLEQSLEVCQTQQLHHCSVYLLGRIGRSREALDVIFDELHDMSAAIAFAKSRTEEPQLWTLLLERALAEPGKRAGEYVGQLLTSAGQSVDPLMLIDRVPAGLEIPRMRDKLVTILREYSFATRMHAGCVQVAERDSFEVAMQSVSARRRAVCYHPSGCDGDGQLTPTRVKKPDTSRGASTVRVKRRAAGALSTKHLQERAEARRQR